jgi:hypothetical protein
VRRLRVFGVRGKGEEWDTVCAAPVGVRCEEEEGWFLMGEGEEEEEEEEEEEDTMCGFSLLSVEVVRRPVSEPDRLQGGEGKGVMEAGGFGRRPSLFFPLSLSLSLSLFLSCVR